jgi:hypothetical protein
LGVAAALALAGGAAAHSQSRNESPPVFRGGFHPGSCGYPRAARANVLSGCCAMTLDIGADGQVRKADGVCTDPVFLEPTRRCLAVQTFQPARRGGRPVEAVYEMEFEWRTGPPPAENLCRKLLTS